MLTVDLVLQYLEQFASPELAADWDNVGLLLGDRSAPVQRLMTCLTVTPESAAEAIEAAANLIVTHHPILFRGTKRLTSEMPEGRMVLELIRAGIAVYSPHTAFDNTEGGINESLCRLLGLQEVGPLRPRQGMRQYKVVVFVPEKDLPGVTNALFAAGAGNIGQYSQCSFRLSGTGTFFGSQDTNPAVGQKGRREEVSEWRLEAVCPEACLDQVIAAMRRAHSYEEPAYDVYPLRKETSARGEGRVGRLPTALQLGELARSIKRGLNAAQVQTIGDPNRIVERVAVVCGAGGGLLQEAVKARADVLLTGELRFHDYLAAQGQGLALVVPGHYATERFAVEELAARLQQQFPGLHAWASQRERDPVNWV